jgi:ABC-2 type transport system permease protein
MSGHADVEGGLRQAWLVAVREMRERARTRAFQGGLALMLVVVVAMILLPTVLEPDGGGRDVGVTGAVPAGLVATIREQGDVAGIDVRVVAYDDLPAGRRAVRDKDVDVLLVDTQRLEWRDRVDEELRAVVTGAVQVTAIGERATAAGIDPAELMALVAPVPVADVELGVAEGRSPEDGTTAIAMTALLMMAIIIYGNMVLTGVVEEKSNRVVEVLLARMPARWLLLGKVAGIGLLGLAQFVLTAVVALLVVSVADSVDLPALSGGVLAWVVVWFVLGYALFATAYGALGSLASRTEDAQSVAGPVGYLLIGCYWAAFLAVSNDPDSAWSRVVSLVPATAPFAMPARIALGASTWWEEVLAVLLTGAAIVGLVVLGGRVYTNAVLHTGPRMRLREAWREGESRTAPPTEPRQLAHR